MAMVASIIHTTTNMNRVARALLISLLTCSCGCPNSLWQVDHTCASQTCFQTVRIAQKPEDKFRGLEIEFVQSSNGLRTYLNNFSLPFSEAAANPSKTEITLRIGNLERIDLADRLKGDQKLLLSDETQALIIHSLLKGDPVEVKAGRFFIHISPADFSKHLPR
jgi:hypothetical protein